MDEDEFFYWDKEDLIPGDNDTVSEETWHSTDGPINLTIMPEADKPNATDLGGDDV